MCVTGVLNNQAKKPPYCDWTLKKKKKEYSSLIPLLKVDFVLWFEVHLRGHLYLQRFNPPPAPISTFIKNS